MKKKLIVILGPTASGKTRLATNLASQIDGEIISADSRQVYREMNIGTGKDYEDYTINGKSINYHLIDIIDAGESYHIAQFQKDFQTAYQHIINKDKTPILCGGSGMYLDAVLNNYEFTQIPIDEDLRKDLEEKTYYELEEIFYKTSSKYSEKADISTKKRLIRAIEINIFLTENTFEFTKKPPINYKVFGIDLPTEIRRERITKRLNERLNNGMIEEVEKLLQKGVSCEKLIFYGLEYKFITQYLTAQLTYSEMVKNLETAIHQFAKRQMTYFRGMERKGMKIHWLDSLKPMNELIEEVLSNF